MKKNSPSKGEKSDWALDPLFDSEGHHGHRGATVKTRGTDYRIRDIRAAMTENSARMRARSAIMRCIEEGKHRIQRGDGTCRRRLRFRGFLMMLGGHRAGSVLRPGRGAESMTTNDHARKFLEPRG
jgi:hypothetical protein